MARINLLRSIGEAMVCFAVGIIRTILVTAVARGPVLRRRFFSKAVPIGFLVGFLTAPAIVLAAGTWQWTAQITGNGMPVLGPFATNEQAVQALGAAIVQRCTAVGLSCPLEATTLVDQGVITMTPTTQTFEYGAVTPSTPGPWSCYFWSDNPTGSNFELILGPTGCYTSEASAVAAQTSMPGCYTQPNGLGGITAYSNYWPTAEGNWSQLFAQSTGGFVEGSSKLYNVYQQNPLLQNNCATTFGYSELLWRARAATCPAGFEPRLNNIGLTTESGSDTPCYGILGGTVTGNNLLDCPANAGPSTLIGDPCNVATGDFTQTEPDYSAAGLNFTRAYHSLTPESRIGVGWTHNYARYLVLTSGTPTGLMRPDGHQDALVATGSGTYISLSGAGIHVAKSGSQWVAYLQDGTEEIYSSPGQLQEIIAPSGLTITLAYNSSGQLISVSDAFGRGLQLSYDSNNRISTLIEPDGSSITYAYDSNNNLISATYPDSSIRQYQYTQSGFPNNLTAILDESNNQFLTVQYDPTTGAVTSSQQAGGAQAVSITYSANGAVATDALGATHTYTFTNAAGYSPRASSLSINGLNQTYSVAAPTTDPQQRVTQYTDPNGNITTYSYDPNHLTSKTEASGTTIARTTSYSTYRDTLTALPTLVTEPLKQTSYVYYPNTYQLHTKTITDTTVTPNVSRTWIYTYDSYGRILTVKSPRTDVNSTTTYAYYTCTTGAACGEIQTITDALGHVTTFNSYNAHGQPLTITDPNNVVATLTYDARLRLLSRQVGTETTSYSYYPTGLLKQVTLPDGSYVLSTYDGAHRLTQISDGLGNSIQYTLDAMGNRTVENTYDPSNTLRRTHTRVINALNQDYQEVNAAGTAAVTTTFAYDNNDNLTSSSAPLSRNTANQYDPLNRLAQITDPASGITNLSYDANDNLSTVQDPRNFTTTYSHDGFGDVTQLVSPDTGTTAKTYDSGGNLLTATDARNAVATYTYDALNRVSQVAYTDQTIHFGYDAGANGVGRLTSASDANHSMFFAYDTHGRVTGKGQTVGGITKAVGYSYTNGDLVSLVTPSGQTIAYSYSNHRITSIAVNGTTILSGVTYDPFGPANGWTWGNGTTTSRTYDEDGNVSQVTSAGVETYSYDNAFRITGITDTATGANNWTYGYDLLDRLTSAAGGGVTDGWTYDANGNRLTQTGSSATTFSIASTSNHLTSITGALHRQTYLYDASGNTLGYGAVTATYDNQGRMTANANSITGVSSTYVYNALGQLIETNLNTVGPRLFWYDEAGHLLGVYNGTGGLGDETVWLGDIPVAILYPSGSGITVYYVHTDHLSTPRQVTRPSDNTQQWTWFSDPFGTTAQNSNPNGNGTFNYQPRFAGQLNTTGVAGWVQNGFRDYDPQTGRYIESDPIGLKGGINTYAYVNNNPVSATDPTGLVMWRGTYLSGSIGYKWAGAEHWTFTLFSDCVNNQKFIIKVSATGAGPGLGLPWTISGSTVEFDDHSATPSPSAFNGVFKFAAAGFAGPIGYGWSEFIAGSATARLSGAVEAGIDFSLSSGVGQSSVTSKGGPFCCNQ